MPTSNPSNFRDLKAAFKSRSKATTATVYRSVVVGDLADMAKPQRSTRVASLAKSIDSVLDTEPASPPTRPLATLRPSWIGPPRPATPSGPTMKQDVVVEYSKAGLQPPVYIFTSLSEPQWEPIEMECHKDEHGECVFTKVFQVYEGEYQYKFRLGPGEWWACDENKSTVDDGHGNKNNLLVVKLGAASIPKVTKADESQVQCQAGNSDSTKPSKTQAAPPVVPLPKPEIQPLSIMTTSVGDVKAPAPAMKHEAFEAHKGPEFDGSRAKQEQNTVHEVEEPATSTPRLLMKHETFSKDVDTDFESALDDSSFMLSLEDALEDEQEAYSLLSHESAKPGSMEEEHAPLFRHESISLGSNHREAPARNFTPARPALYLSTGTFIPAEADAEDLTLERFPTDHDGIIHRIHHAYTRLQEDETSDESVLGSPVSQALTESPTSASSPRPMDKVVDEILEKIREAEEEEVEREEAEGDEAGPLGPGAAVTLSEPEDADFEPKIYEIEETIVVEFVEKRRGSAEVLVDKIGGKSNAIAAGVGLLVIAAGICTMQLL